MATPIVQTIEASHREDEDLSVAFASFLEGPRAGTIARRSDPTTALRTVEGPKGDKGDRGEPGPPGKGAEPSVWVFDVVRDPVTGLIMQIIAKPKP